MSSLVFVCFPRSQDAGDCNEGCEKSATGLRKRAYLVGPPSTVRTLSGTCDYWNRRLLTVIYFDGHKERGNRYDTGCVWKENGYSY